MRNGLHVDEYGTRIWHVNDLLHRTDGPAVEWPSGGCWWYWYGKGCTFHEWLKINTEITPQQKMLLMLKYADK